LLATSESLRNVVPQVVILIVQPHLSSSVVDLWTTVQGIIFTFLRHDASDLAELIHNERQDASLQLLPELILATL